MKRVALYIRVSTQEQAIHGLSIEAQTEALDAWAKQNEVMVVDHYVDAGISARKPSSKRPELQRLLADARAGKIDLLVFTKLDRWFRNVGEYYKVQEILEKYHVDWKTIYEDYDTSTAAGRLKINIMLSVAQDEADRTSERIKVVFDAKRERREPLTGNCPTGYRIEGKKLVKDEKTRDAVEAFFRKYLSSGSVSEAQAHVQEEYQFRIEYQLASKMLDSPAYYGYYYGVGDMCPPYITKEEFEKIQAMRSRTVRKAKDNRVYLFSGLIVCGACGYRMGGRTNSRGATPFYNCPSRYIRKACSNSVNLAESKIAAYIMDTIDFKLSQYKIDFRNLRDREKGRNYQTEISAVKAKLSRLKDLYLNELISLEEFQADQKPLKARLEELTEAAKPLKIPDFGRADALLVKGWRTAYEELDRPSRRDFWRILIKEIRIFPDRRIDYDLLL
ncbi:MAG: recombinase family protein [Ruminococcus flavefaciens]|nr:recombinase family protein [Ruminococcus flavefaciens]